jgi:hypothetical protein
MKRTLIDQLLGTAGEWLRPWPTVEPDPAGAGDGGGGGGTGEELDPDDPSLGEAGQKALRQERETRKALERRLAQMETQLATVKDLSPDAYRQAQEKAIELERRLAEREQLTAAERQRIESKANEAVRKATTTAEAEKARRIALEVKTMARGVFSAADGRDGADASGLSFFDAWMEFQGKRHLRVDETNGKLYVVDNDGDRVKSAEGVDVDPVAWLNQQADNSAVVGTFFRAKGGEGSGGFVGARGVRGVQGRSVEQARGTSGSAFLSEHYGNG